MQVILLSLLLLTLVIAILYGALYRREKRISRDLRNELRDQIDMMEREKAAVAANTQKKLLDTIDSYINRLNLQTEYHEPLIQFLILVKYFVQNTFSLFHLIDQASIIKSDIGTYVGDLQDRLRENRFDIVYLLDLSENLKNLSVSIQGSTIEFSKLLKIEKDSFRSVIDEGKEVTSNITEIYSVTNLLSETTSVLTDIADKVQMLSLNAQIEASRSGKEGSGFSIIATQMGALAGSSKDYAVQIDTIIHNINLNLIRNLEKLEAFFEKTTGIIERIIQERDRLIAELDDHEQILGLFSRQLKDSSQSIRDIIRDVSETIAVLNHIGHILQLKHHKESLDDRFVDTITGIHVELSSKRIMRIGYINIIDHLLLPLTRHHHTFDKMDLSLINFTDWAALITAIENKTVDAAFLFAPALLALNNKNIFMRCVMLGHRNGSSFIVSKTSGIGSLPGLKGKRIGIPAALSTHKALLSRTISAHGMSMDDIEIVYLKPYQMNNALRINEIDAFFVAEPYGAIAEKNGYGDILLYSKGIVPGHICCVFCVQTDYLASGREQVRTLMHRMIETAGQFESNRNKEIKTVADIFAVSEDITRMLLNNPADRITYRDLKPTVNDFMVFAEPLMKERVISKFLYEEYVDDSLFSGQVS